MNPIEFVRQHGQSIWLDSINRAFIRNGKLKCMVQQDQVTGVAGNPTLFGKASNCGHDYDERINRLLITQPQLTAYELYDQLSVEDVRMAADVLRKVYADTGGADGFVSIEVSPSLARTTQLSISEAMRLWERVDRANLMIKIPATVEGVPAIEELLAQGVNVNVTFIFSLEHYNAAAAAFLRGLERASDPAHTASIASVIVGRVDTAIDRALNAIGTPEALALRGKVAVANAKLIYARFRELFDNDRFAALRLQGARIQRLLWGSTGTKNPAYSDVLYVEELIGPDTVNTLPPATLQAFQDHGCVRGLTLEEARPEAELILSQLAELNIDLGAITRQLQSDGVAALEASLDKLLSSLQARKQQLVHAS